MNTVKKKCNRCDTERTININDIRHFQGRLQSVRCWKCYNAMRVSEKELLKLKG